MTLSDEARSILAFAAYHQLSSGEVVRDVILEDDAGHRADSAGVTEMKEAGFLKVEGTKGRFTDEGAELMERFIEALRAVA